MAQLKSLNVLGNIAVSGNIVANGNIAVNGKLDINKLNIPIASDSATLGPGANGQVLKSNGTSIYWGTDNNDVTNVSFTRHVTDGTKIGTITINNTSTDIYSGTHNKVNQSVSSYDGWRKIMLSSQYDTDKTFAVETTDDILYASAALRCHPRTGGIDSAGTINAVTLSEGGTALSKKYVPLSGDSTITGILSATHFYPKDAGMGFLGNIDHKFNSIFAHYLYGADNVEKEIKELVEKSDVASLANTKVTQAYSTTSNSYPLLMTAAAGVTSTSSRGETTTILCNKLYANPNTGALTSKSRITASSVQGGWFTSTVYDGAGALGEEFNYITTDYQADCIYIDYEDANTGDSDSHYLWFPKKSGTLATTSDIPKYLHTCEVTCSYSGNGTKATVFFSFYSTKSTAYNKITFAKDSSVIGRVYPATGYIKANSLGLSIVQYIRFLSTSGSSTVYIKYLNENILGTFPTEIQSSFSDLKDTVTTVS